VDVSLDVRDGPIGRPLVRFNQVTLPEGFVQRIKESLAERTRRKADFYRSLFPQPSGTSGATPAASRPNK